MATTQQKREWWADWRCNSLEMVAVTFPGSDRDWNLPVADAAAPAFEYFADLMRKHDYLFREVSGGTYNCRKIAGTDSWSLHAYGIAIDLNPSKNPYGTTTHDFPQGFIDDVLDTGLFRWGMEFRDPMHWEIDVPPSGIQLPEEDHLFIAADGRNGWPKKGPVVEYWQHFLRKLDPSYDPGVGGWGDATTREFAAELAKFSPGDPVIGPGEKLALEVRLAQKVAPTPTTSAHDHDGRYVKNVSVSK